MGRTAIYNYSTLFALMLLLSGCFVSETKYFSDPELIVNSDTDAFLKKFWNKDREFPVKGPNHYIFSRGDRDCSLGFIRISDFYLTQMESCYPDNMYVYMLSSMTNGKPKIVAVLGKKDEPEVLKNFAAEYGIKFSKYTNKFAPDINVYFKLDSNVRKEDFVIFLDALVNSDLVQAIGK